MKVNQNIVLKIIGLEFLLMIFYTLNGAYQTITKPSSPVLQFIGLVLSLLIVNKQSIIMNITFHTFNNFFNFMGNVQASSLFAYVIIVILFFYTIYLWKRANKKECIWQEINIAV
ncbi:hypothetical protein [Bacillus wiedmannii]|uniref:hypothetical protein n=1 Tax=Bacillus wiedmannii TaxID=1890302 RepID=UPI003D301E79